MNLGFIRFAFLAGVAIGCAACTDDSPVRTESREVPSFNAIDMRGGARLEISIGQGPSVQVEAPENTLPNVKTEVREQTLYIEGRFVDWVQNGAGPGVTVRVSVPTLASLRLSGGNEVRVTGFSGGSSNIHIEGFSSFEAEGALDELIVRMAGAGNADLRKLLAKNARVTVDGVATVHVHPQETLDATMNGVGAIFYTGSPREVSTHINGLGTISRDDRDSTEEESVERGEETPDPEEMDVEYDVERQTV